MTFPRVASLSCLIVFAGAVLPAQESHDTPPDPQVTVTQKLRDDLFSNFVAMIRRRTGKKIGIEMGVDERITLELKDVHWMTALSLAAEKANCVILVTKDDRLRITRPPSVWGTDMQAELERYQRDPIARLDVRTQMFRLRHVQPVDATAELLPRVRQCLTPKVGTVEHFAKTNMLLVKDTRRALDDIRSILGQLDRSDRTVYVQVRFARIERQVRDRPDGFTVGSWGGGGRIPLRLPFALDAERSESASFLQAVSDVQRECRLVLDSGIMGHDLIEVTTGEPCRVHIHEAMHHAIEYDTRDWSQGMSLPMDLDRVLRNYIEATGNTHADGPDFHIEIAAHAVAGTEKLFLNMAPPQKAERGRRVTVQHRMRSGETVAVHVPQHDTVVFLTAATAEVVAPSVRDAQAEAEMRAIFQPIKAGATTTEGAATDSGRTRSPAPKAPDDAGR